MSRKHVNELEAETTRDFVYLDGHGLRVNVNQGPNTWFQLVTTLFGRQTTMKLGKTRRLSFVNAQKIGSVLKEWATYHTMEECGDASKRFLGLAKTDVVVGRKRVPWPELESAWRRAISGDGQTVDHKLLASLSAVQPHGGGGGGEGPEHDMLKEYVKRTPSFVGLPPVVVSESEYELPSHDSVDVMFCHDGKMVAVEVKSKISDAADVCRGLYQCIKYKAVTEAMLRSMGKKPNVRSVLVLGLPLPSTLKTTQMRLGVEVIENVKVRSSRKKSTGVET